MGVVMLPRSSGSYGDIVPFVFYRTRHHGSLRLEPGTEDDFCYALERTSKFAKRNDLLSLPVDALLWIQVGVLLRSSHTHIVAASLTPPVKPISNGQSESKLCGTWPGFIQQGHKPIDMCVTSQTPYIKHPDGVILCEKLCCQRKMLYSSQQSESICCPVVGCSRHPTAKWCSYIYRTLVLLIPSNMIDSHIGLPGATFQLLSLSNSSLAGYYWLFLPLGLPQLIAVAGEAHGCIGRDVRVVPLLLGLEQSTGLILED